MIELAGKVALVTGAGRGLGRAVALGLADRGVDVAAVARTVRDLDALRESATGLAGEVEPVPADVTDPVAVAMAIGAVGSELGPPSILINAAGMFGPISTIAESDPEEWFRTLEVNLRGPYLMVRACLPAMLQSGWGRIINVSSAASLHSPGPLNSAYATSKVALNQFTRHLAAEIAGSGVTANVIHPGDLKTDMWVDIAEQARAAGPAAKAYQDWVDWVGETGGDPESKAVDLICGIVSEDRPRNGEFCWIEDPLQPPIPSWQPVGDVPPWLPESR